MKNITTFALASVFASVAATAAVTDPVGYCTFDGQAGNNLYVPPFVNPAAFAGDIVGSGATTLTFPAATFTGGEFDQEVLFGYATHYVEFTSGPNTGVNVSIASNTATEITLEGDITSLALNGDESVVIRPHVTVKQALEGGEASFSLFTDSVTVYETDGTPVTFLYTSAGVWSSDFGTNVDGNDRPIAPGTGVILGLLGNLPFVVTGEVKDDPTVVQLVSGTLNIVGPTNPLVGTTTQLDALGFQNLLAFTDSVTLYTPGSLALIDTYLPNGAGQMLDGGFNPSTAGIPSTTGSLVTPGAGDTNVTLETGFTVAP